MMIGNQGGHVRKPVQPSRNCLSIQVAAITMIAIAKRIHSRESSPRPLGR